MRIRIWLFAAARDLLGDEEIVVELDDDARMSDLKRVLIEQFPAAAEIISRSAFAREHQYVVDDEPLQDGNQLALIPPVSGG